MVKLKPQYLMAAWCKELTQWKRPWCWARLKAGEGDDRGWDGWMTSLTCWTWVWASSGSCWWTGRPSMLQSMGLQRVRHDWLIELNLYKTIIFNPNLSKYPQNNSKWISDQNLKPKTIKFSVRKYGRNFFWQMPCFLRWDIKCTIYLIKWTDILDFIEIKNVLFERQPI